MSFKDFFLQLGTSLNSIQGFLSLAIMAIFVCIAYLKRKMEGGKHESKHNKDIR